MHALIFTAVVSRHMFVWLTYSQTLVAMIAGCEAAWEIFGGVFKVLIDNLKAVVTHAGAVNPRLSTGWLDYAQHVGFAGQDVVIGEVDLERRHLPETCP